MKIRLEPEDNIRVVADHKGNNFADVKSISNDSMAITLHCLFQYIELRKKDGILQVFTFPNKAAKKGIDLGWWADAEVVYAVNEQIMNK